MFVLVYGYMTGVVAMSWSVNAVAMSFVVVGGEVVGGEYAGVPYSGSSSSLSVGGVYIGLETPTPVGEET